VTFTDAVRGGRALPTPTSSAIPVIVRADGHPAYNFAVVVDDALMEVTHVIGARITFRTRRGNC